MGENVNEKRVTYINSETGKKLTTAVQTDGAGTQLDNYTNVRNKLLTLIMMEVKNDVTNRKEFEAATEKIYQEFKAKFETLNEPDLLTLLEHAIEDIKKIEFQTHDD
ncbi:hypothetical protein BAZO_18501 [Schinkia azotoformans LMG 9581]|uniref:Uncharacterized protein n=1 Tax=Schinkia azotoformans LMG 9581 TaxID=1131731 RepID=K6DR51_SCHAZ|nr:hypothetical protein BAZO_18501 [Schinkia azotoformans LMG 9581]